MARIAHLDADAFFVSVHLREQPQLRGRPVVVAGTGSRSVVTTASYEARKYGIFSAASAVRARQLCPHATFIEPDIALYRSASAQMWEIVREHLGDIEQLGLDEAYADLSAHPAPVSTLRAAVGDVRVQTGLQLSVGLGPNRLVAKVASDAEKPRGFTVLSREQACERSAQSPPSLIPGIGPVTARHLQGLGVSTIADLREISETILAIRFSERFIGDLKARANFHGAEQITTDRIRKSCSAEDTFALDIENLEQLTDELVPLAARVSKDLRKRDVSGNVIGIKVRLDDFTTYTRDRTLRHKTCDEQQILTVARELLDASPPGRPVRLLGIKVGGLDIDEIPQLRLFA